MGSDDEIYGDAPDNMDSLMDAGGYDLVDQYVSNVFLCNELTKSTVPTIALIHLNMDHMSCINYSTSWRTCLLEFKKTEICCTLIH